MTIFTKIINREIPATIVYEDANVLAFKDIYPQAPIHIIFIHKRPTAHINELVAQDPAQLPDLFKAIANYTAEQNLESKGFRLVTNVGRDGGQSVHHTHFHLLAGSPLGKFGV